MIPKEARELKTLNVEERFINYKVFSYLWLANTLQRIKENVLFVEKNFNQQMEEAKPVQMNVGKKGNFNMIKSILKQIQKSQEKLLKTGRRIIKAKLIKEQKKDGKKINVLKSEIRPTNLLERKGFQDMGNVNCVEIYQTEKPTILNIQRRILF